MAFEVDDVEQADTPHQGVSGAVIQALVAYIRDASGDSGLAQALALASENRSFLSLGDDSTWTPVDEAAALFAAGALVTGDDAIALHVGEELLWGGVGADLAARIQSLDSPEVAFRHVGAEGAAMERHILEDFDENPAEPEHRDRAEHRIAHDAHDAFGAAGELFGDQHACDARGGGMGAGAAGNGAEVGPEGFPGRLVMGIRWVAASRGGPARGGREREWPRTT